MVFEFEPASVMQVGHSQPQEPKEASDQPKLLCRQRIRGIDRGQHHLVEGLDGGQQRVVGVVSHQRSPSSSRRSSSIAPNAAASIHAISTSWWVFPRRTTRYDDASAVTTIW